MAHEHENNPELAERQAQWARHEGEVDHIVDGLGKPIDAGIKEAVVALQAHGITTTQSCEGHDDHGHALPMVLIEAEEPPDWQENEQAKVAWTAANTAMVEKIQTIVDEWYRRRTEDGEVVAEDKRLVLAPRGIFGAADLEPAGQEKITALAELERRQQAGAYRGEMQKFSAHLKEQFLHGFSTESMLFNRYD